jgi:predicted nucleic acid-binding protein
MQVNQLLLNKTIELPSAIGVSDKEISEETKKLLDIANNAFTEKNKPVHLIDLGETACVALAKILNKNSIPNLLVIDERTTRMLCEKPDNLRKLLTKKHHTTIKYDKNSLAEFTGFKIIRSAELAFLAHKKGIVKIKDKKVLDALIYALKFKGCSISTEEIEELKRMK